MRIVVAYFDERRQMQQIAQADAYEFVLARAELDRKLKRMSRACAPQTTAEDMKIEEQENGQKFVKIENCIGFTDYEKAELSAGLADGRITFAIIRDLGPKEFKGQTCELEHIEVARIDLVAARRFARLLWALAGGDLEDQNANRDIHTMIKACGPTIIYTEKK